MAAFGRRSNDPPTTPAISFGPGMPPLPGTAPGNGPTIPPPTAADSPTLPAPPPPPMDWSATPPPYAAPPSPTAGWAPAGYAPPAYAGSPYAGAPVSDTGPSKRTVIVSCVLAAVVGLVVLGSIGQVAMRNEAAIERKRQLTIPVTVSQLPQVHTPEIDSILGRTVQELTAVGFPGAAVGAYGRDGVPALMLGALPVARSDEADKVLETFLNGLNRSIPVLAGERPTMQRLAGQEYRCERVQLTGVPASFWRCAWASRLTVGMVLYQGTQVVEAADAAHSARLGVEV